MDGGDATQAKLSAGESGLTRLAKRPRQPDADG
jgi:hypothetical protein